MGLADRIGRHPRGFLSLVMIGFVLYGTLIPFDLRVDAETLAAGWRQAHGTPFRTPDGRFPSRTDLVGNLLLFGVLGLCLQGALDPRGRRPAAGVLGAAVLGSLLSAIVEALQLFSPSRVTSLTDWIVNTLGALAGAGVGLVYSLRVSQPLGRWVRATASANPVGLAAAVFGLVLVIDGLAPFNVSIDMSDLARNARRVQLAPFQRPGGLGATEYGVGLFVRACTWAGLGFLAGYGTGRRPGGVVQPGRAALWGTLLPTGLAAAIEVAQLVIVDRVPNLTDVLTAGMGSAAGAILSAAYLAAEPRESAARWDRARQTARLALAGGIGLMLVDRASPFHFQWSAVGAGVKVGQLIPLYAYFTHTTLWAVEDMIDGISAGLGLGVLAALLWTGPESGDPGQRRQAVGRAALLAGLVALAGEGLQLAIPTRTPDITDVLTVALGGAVGAWCWRRYSQAIASGASGLLNDDRLRACQPQGHGQGHR